MMKKLNQRIFDFVANKLIALARVFRITYNEINIIVYYFIIPLSWLSLIDLICDFHYLKFSFLIFSAGFFVGCRDFRSYSDELFMKSVDFLNYFNRFGQNYVAASVIICVLIPIVIYAILIYFAFA
jgi:hypothetical protein